VGERLVVLDQSDLMAKLRRAEATLAAAQVDFETTKRDATFSSGNTLDTLSDAVRNAYVQADNVVRNTADRFFDDPRGRASFNASFLVGSTNYFIVPKGTDGIGLGSERRDIEDMLEAWGVAMSKINADNVSSLYTTSLENLRTIQRFMDRLSLVINSYVVTDSESGTIVSGFKSSVAEGRTSINTAITTLINAKGEYDSAPYLLSGERKFNVVLSSEAEVEALRADVDAIRADLADTVIYSPVNGVITRREAEVGEIVTAGEDVVSIISDSEIRIEANVSEVNIGKVSEGDKVSVTFDAFGSRVFSGEVIYIDPGETLVDDVPTYKITVAFEDEGVDIRSGLTANLKITTAEATGVLKVPAYAVEREGGKTFVQVLGPKGTEEVEVEVGIRGKDGSLEIKSGLEEGDQVVLDK
jgi:multidrug efflux pump subunit AcrA (membrane-fusion protein)